MKRLLYLKQLLAVFCFVTCLQNSGFSQEKKTKVLFGLQGGVNINKIIPLPKAFSFGESYKWTPSYDFGGFVDIYLAKRLYVESGANILLRKSNALPRTVGTKSLDNYYDGYKKYTIYYETRFNHEIWAVQIPLALHVDVLQKKNFRANIYAGLMLEQTIRYEVKETNSIRWDPIPPQDVIDGAGKYTNTTWSSWSTTFFKTSYGGMIGIGISYKKIGIDINYNGAERTYSEHKGNVAHYKMPCFMMNLRYQIN